MTPEQRREIVAFLTEIKADGAQSAARFDALDRAVRDVANTQARTEAGVIQLQEDVSNQGAELRLIKSRLDRHGKRIRDVEQQASVNVDPLDITSSHNIHAVMRTVQEIDTRERKRESFFSFVKKQSVAFFFASLLLALGGCGSVVWAVAKQAVRK